MTKEKLEKLKELLKIADEGLTRKEFLSAFKEITNHLLKLDIKLVEKINKSIQSLTEKHKGLTNNNEIALSEMNKQLVKNTDKMFNEQRQNLAFITDKAKRIKSFKDGIDGQNGQDGKDADEEKIINEVLSKIKIPEIDTSEFDKLKEELFEEIRRNKRLGGGGFSKIAMDGHLLDPYTPTGTVNGTNTDFVLLQSANPTSSLKVYVNGMLMSLTEDYTVSGVTVTMNTAPPTNSIIKVEHRI